MTVVHDIKREAEGVTYTSIAGRHEPLLDCVDVIRLQDLTQQVHHLKQTMHHLMTSVTSSLSTITYVFVSCV